MNIYTKTGDKGQTSLATGERVSKTDERLEAYGTSDELNSFVGLLRAGKPTDDIDQQLYYIQNRLFDLGAKLAGAGMTIPDDADRTLETWIDRMQATLPPLREFILPSGNTVVSYAHICRTVTRRLERNMLRIADAQTNLQHELVFVNRLSDYFFVLARFIAKNDKIEVSVWQK